MTLKVIHRLQAFSNVIRRTFVQHFTRFQLTVSSYGYSALADILVLVVVSMSAIDRLERLVSEMTYRYVSSETLNSIHTHSLTPSIG